MSGEARPVTRTITSILIEAGTLTQAQVQAGLDRQKLTGTRIGQALVELGVVTEQDIGWALARQLGIPFIDLMPETLDRELIASFPPAVLDRLIAVPLLKFERGVSVAFGDPTDHEAVAEIERLVGVPVQISAAAPTAIRGVLDSLAPSAPRTHRPQAGHAASEIEHDRSGTRALVAQVERALEGGASEIHFIPGEDSLAVHHRVGDRLVPRGSEPLPLLYYLLARIEALGGPVIAGDEVHASGRVICPLGDHEVRLDASLLGCEAGVAITLGLRAASSSPPALDQLGLDPVDLARLRGVLDVPVGLIVVSGPGRSGCSTTLASLLAAADGEGRKSIAFERGTGAPLAASVRLLHDGSTARASWEAVAVGQDADVIALDDLLTGETVDGVLASAGSGRMLLVSTDWPDTFALIEHLMARPGGRSILADRLRLVVQQRRARLSSAPGQTGAGRRALFEALFVGEPMRAAIRAGAPVSELRVLAAADGFRSLSERVSELRSQRLLSPAEAARVLS